MTTNRYPAAGALAAGAVVVSVPGLATADPATGPAGGVGMRRHASMMIGVDGYADRPGFCASYPLSAPPGTLTDGQRATLRDRAEREKLAHDLYLHFAGRYDIAVFGRVAVAETHLLAMVRSLLRRYGIVDPTESRPAGRFATPAVRSAYERMVARGGHGRAAAFQVAREAEWAELTDLRRALDASTAPDVRQAYQHLSVAAQRHLELFTAWSGR